MTQHITKTYSIQTSAGYWVSRLARAMESDFEKRLSGYNVTRASWAVLSAIFHEAKTTPADIATFIGVDRAAVTRLLDRLETLDLIARDRDRTDRRSVNLSVTQKGKRLAAQLAAESRATNDKFCSGLTSAEIDRFVATTRKALSNDDAPQDDL